MAKHRFHVNLPNGEKVWLTGDTISEAFCSGLEKYAAPAPPSKKKASPTLRAYGEKWFRLYHQPKVKRNTANNTRILLEKHIFPALGKKRLEDVTFDDVRPSTTARLCCRAQRTRNFKSLWARFSATPLKMV